MPPHHWFQIALQSLRRSPSERHLPGQALDRVIKDLESLNADTERDFLAIGESLIGFRSTSRQLYSDISSLTELLAGDQAGNASRSLSGILKLSAELNAQMERSTIALAQIHEFSSHIRIAFAGLGNTVSLFRTLCTLTRIETSRLGNTGAGFGDLAAEARPLSESIQKCAEGILEGSSRLDQIIQSALRIGSGLRDTQRKDLPVIVADVSECLTAFEERLRCARETSIRQAAGHEALCGEIDGVVRSVQFHDITRQQTEHVTQALRQLCCKMGSGPLPAGVRPILAVQSSQLAGAAKLFAASVERTQGDLQSMGARVEEMAEASRALMGISADERDSFFLTMERNFTAILEMLRNCAAAQTDMEATVPFLEDTIRAMSNSIAEIRGIEIRIHRIATNAVIRAIHIGAPGNGLNVIAEIMGKLALDSSRNTEAAAEAIQAMSLAAGSVSDHSTESSPTARSNTQELIAGMRRTILDLHSSSECSFSRVSQISDSGRQLVSDIAALRDGFSAGPLFARVVGQARAELDRIAGESAGETVDGAPATQLDSLAALYTMQLERDVHASVTGGSEAPADLCSAAFQDGDLGDNVELF